MYDISIAWATSVLIMGVLKLLTGIGVRPLKVTSSCAPYVQLTSRVSIDIALRSLIIPIHSYLSVLVSSTPPWAITISNALTMAVAIEAVPFPMWLRL